MARSADMNNDGMVSKAEMMAMVEKAWMARDKKGAGMLSHDDASKVLLFLSGMGTSQ